MSTRPSVSAMLDSARRRAAEAQPTALPRYGWMTCGNCPWHDKHGKCRSALVPTPGAPKTLMANPMLGRSVPQHWRMCSHWQGEKPERKWT